MKKLIAILLTLAVLCSFGVSALAADTEVHEFVWDKIATDTAEIDPDGGFHQVGGYCIWLPSFYASQDLSQERINQGYVANIEAADRSSAILVFTDTNEEKADLEALAKAYTGAGFEAEVVRVNGIPAVLYVNTEADTINVMYLEGEDATLTFSFYPYSDEGFAGLSHVMISSLQRSLVWALVEDIAAQVDPNGQIAEIGDSGFGLWVPSVLTDVPLTEEDVENGMVAFLQTEDESASVAIFIWGENYDFDKLVKYYEDEGFAEEDVEVVLINGFKAVAVNDEKNDCVLVDYLLEDGRVLEFSFWPASDEGFAQLSSLMIASIQTVS